MASAQPCMPLTVNAALGPNTVNSTDKKKTFSSISSIISAGLDSNNRTRTLPSTAEEQSVLLVAMVKTSVAPTLGPTLTEIAMMSQERVQQETTSSNSLSTKTCGSIHTKSLGQWRLRMDIQVLLVFPACQHWYLSKNQHPDSRPA